MTALSAQELLHTVRNITWNGETVWGYRSASGSKFVLYFDYERRDRTDTLIVSTVLGSDFTFPEPLPSDRTESLNTFSYRNLLLGLSKFQLEARFGPALQYANGDWSYSTVNGLITLAFGDSLEGTAASTVVSQVRTPRGVFP